MEEIEKIKLISSIECIFKENEMLKIKLVEQQAKIKKQLVIQFSTQIVYWVDGYKEIFDELGLTEAQQELLYGKLMEHQRAFIERVLA